MAAASTPHEPNCIPETETHTDVMRRLEAAFDRFWHNLNERLQAPQATLQTLPRTSKLNRPRGERRQVPSHRQAARKTGVVSGGKRSSTPGKVTAPKLLIRHLLRRLGTHRSHKRQNRGSTNHPLPQRDLARKNRARVCSVTMMIFATTQGWRAPMPSPYLAQPMDSQYSPHVGVSAEDGLSEQAILIPTPTCLRIRRKVLYASF
ncbi:Hypothetical predicted protein [Pelobates cultripes]|uniref:Uncharacterized protein n=1 Tax=Pelobates cultripes TaxID=61616 RepID=A0AAD1R091_PELCU|nr:Hypothetical predicted protein [Pelobates cultripes]